MACSTSTTTASTGRGLRAEAVLGSMPGMTGCGCGCSAEEVGVGWMPGLAGLGLSVTVPSRGGAAYPGLGRSVAAGGGCGLFEIPTTSTDGLCDLDCSSELRGTGEECQEWIEDCGTHKLTESELEAYANTEIPPTIHGETDMARELIQAAWSLLNDNLDLVRWAICLLYGASRAERVMDRLTDYVDGKAWLDIGVSDTTYGGPFFVPPFLPTAPPTRISNLLIIVRGSEFWQGYLKKWSSGDLSTMSCVALDFAAGLAHELCHVARYNTVDLGEGKCHESYIIGNTVRWAIFQRYDPALMDNSDCCPDKAGDSMFSCGNTDAKFRSCAEGSGDPDDSGYSGIGERLADWAIIPAEFMVRLIENRLELLWEAAETVVEIAVEVIDCIINVRECLDLGPGGSDGGGGGGSNDAICEVCPWLCVGGMGHGGSDDEMTACIDAIMASMMDKDSDDPYDMITPRYDADMEEADG